MLKIISDNSQKGGLVSQKIKFNNYGQVLHSYYSAGGTSQVPIDLTVKFQGCDETFQLLASGQDALMFDIVDDNRVWAFKIPRDGLEYITYDYATSTSHSCERKKPKKGGIVSPRVDDEGAYIHSKMEVWETKYKIPRWASRYSPMLFLESLPTENDSIITHDCGKYCRTEDGNWWHKRNNHHWDLIDKMQVQDFGNEEGDFELVYFKSPYEDYGILYNTDLKVWAIIAVSEGRVFTTETIQAGIGAIKELATASE